MQQAEQQKQRMSAAAAAGLGKQQESIDFNSFSSFHNE